MDRETVIRGLECCAARNGSCQYKKEPICPYVEHCQKEDYAALQRDVLALLKEQEAKPMIENEIGWNCPSCELNLIGKTASGYPCDLIDLPEDEPIHFCPRCGQAVKWE